MAFYLIYCQTVYCADGDSTTCFVLSVLSPTPLIRKCWIFCPALISHFLVCFVFCFFDVGGGHKYPFSLCLPACTQSWSFQCMLSVTVYSTLQLISVDNNVISCLNGYGSWCRQPLAVKLRAGTQMDSHIFEHRHANLHECVTLFFPAFPLQQINYHKQAPRVCCFIPL